MAAREGLKPIEVEGSSPSPANMADDLKNAIEENATGPKRASGDSGSVEQHSLADQIAADKYLQSKQAAATKGLGIKLLKISPGGTT